MMMMSSLFPLTICLAVTLVGSGTVEAAAEQAEEAGEQHQCGLYLAPSSQSTEGDFRWGMYIGHDDLPEGEMIGYPNLAVNLHDFKANNLDEYSDDGDEYAFLRDQAQLVLNQAWIPSVGGAAHEFEDDVDLPEGETHSGLAISGPGFLAAYDSRRTNADFDVVAGYNGGGGGEETTQTGVAHPGRGAVSPFTNVVVRSTEYIPAGSEILLNYDLSGEEIAEDEKSDEATILKDDYKKIDETIDEMLAFFEKHEDNLDMEAKQQIYLFLTNDFMSAAVGEAKAQKVAELFPPTPGDLPKVKEAGGIARYSSSQGSGSSSSYRKLDWLQKNGLCMDNLRPGPSSIPNAGRGAFATRTISKDGMVAPVPLLHIPDKIGLDMYTLFLTEDDVLAREEDSARGKQLLTNYVYAHPETTMAFLPLGASVGLINHSAKPNARLQWSKHPSYSSKNEEWFQVKPHEFLLEDKYYAIGLMMEVVALDDIAEGDEITINYGEEWQTAWEQHTKEWQEKIELGEIDEEWPVRAADLNEQHTTAVFRTEDEQEEEPYPLHVTLKAFISMGEGEGTEDDPFVWKQPAQKTSFSVNDLYDVEIQEREELERESDGDGDDDDSETAPLCVYTVTVPSPSDEDEVLYVSDVPHEAFVFVDDAETGDQFTEGAFRMTIGIPDDVFPQGVWRNVD